MKKEMRYFSYHPDAGFGLFATEKEAKEHAHEDLAMERSDACEGWSDYVYDICWGEIKQHIIMSECRKRTEEDTFVSDDCDEIVDYALVDIDSSTNNILTADEYQEVFRNSGNTTGSI